MWVTRAILGVFLLGTLWFAWMMEYAGNRQLNESVHHAIHVPEAFSNRPGPFGVYAPLA